RKGNKVVLFAMGLMVQEALKAAEELDATVVNVSTLKPLDEEGIKELLRTHEKAYACEEHSIIGGLFSAISEVKAKTDITTPVYPIGINDTFGESGKAKDVLKKYGLTAEHILEVVKG
ncbi:MAG: transketolase family protein, partial [Erysipelotrichaceae bacterium]|nr:transketolase family protein [Erysipelotrichaceae bacterium]